MEDDAVLLMQGANKLAHRGPQHALHWRFLRRDDMNLDFSRAQARRHLETNETRPDNNGLSRLGGVRDDRLAVGERTQSMDMRQIGAGNFQPRRLGAGRQQQGIEFEHGAVGERDGF